MKKQKNSTKQKASKNKFSQYLLDSITVDDIRAIKQTTGDLLKYQWDYYSELARQRNIIKDLLQQALIQTSISYEISKWQRAVKYKYGLHPLSTLGSLSFIGGRFNTGESVNTQIPFFPGLYLAKDKDTALQEHLGQEKPLNMKLTAREIALTNPSSETIVSVSGKLDKVFDLTDYKKLMPFVELIKNFTFSPSLILLAKKLKIEPPSIVKSARELRGTLLCDNWRFVPVNYDIPSNSQIFGHLVYISSIEGILYPSKFTKKSCLVVFTRNFIRTDSYISIDDEPPHPKVPTRIDASNWRISEMDIKEIIT